MGAETAVRRVLIVSANIGEGHNATGRALADTVRKCWPDAEIRWVDTLDAMGGRVGPAFRWIYVTNVEKTPWLYQFFYSALWRHRWFAEASKRLVGRWAGRALRPVVREFRPDLVLSSYPMGSAGLDWLRRRGECAAPVGAWVSDFAPHPFWVYEHIDTTVVMHEAAVRPALRCVPAARITVGAATVGDGFVPGDRAKARARLDLPAQGFLALVSCGSLGFGAVRAAVTELLAADSAVTVAAICGRNVQLRAELTGMDDPRVIALGWTDRVPELLVAADVLVTNAGGATALEALACECPVLMYRPIAAHGRANAELMASAGLATLCARPGSLRTAVAELIAHPLLLERMREQARAHNNRGSELDEQLRTLAGEHAAPHRLRAQDSLFLQIDRETIPQQLGAALILEAKPDGSPATEDDALLLLEAVPGGAGRIRAGSRWRPARLVTDPGDEPRARLSMCDIAEQVADLGEHRALDLAMAEFFSARIDPYQQASAARLLTGLPAGRGVVLIGAHHVFTDGIALTNSVVGSARGRPWSVQSAPYDVTESVRFGELAQGLGALASAGSARRGSLQRTVSSARRAYRRTVLSVPTTQRVANELGLSIFDVLLGLLAEAIYQTVPDARGGFRLMVPQSTRTVRTFRSAGNHSGAVTVALPMGDLPVRRRILATARVLRARADSGAPAAARWVIRLMGALPPWLHRLAARGSYSGKWFSMIASVLPGARGKVVVRGSLMSMAYPVLPLAPGNAYAVGFMVWGKEIAMCVTTDAAGDELAARWCAEVAAQLDALAGVR